MNESQWDDLSIPAATDLEQAETNVDALTITISTFFHALVKQGMTRAEATVLTTQFMKSMFDANKANNG